MAGRFHITRWVVGIVSAALIALAIFQLEERRAGVERLALDAGAPATLYRTPGAEGPLVVVAHGFAGSRQLMEAMSLSLARAGYRALAFDFQGHGRNPAPMGGDVNAIEGTTARLIDETLAVAAAGRDATGWTGPAALVGHSMATDVIIRAALRDPEGIGPLVAISSFSKAVTATAPPDLLIVNGAWEPGLRGEARRVMALADEGAGESDTVETDGFRRRAVAAPSVEHVGVLYSRTTLTEAVDWLDGFYGRKAGGPAGAPPATTGGWIALLLGGVVALGWALAAALPTGPPGPTPSRRHFWIALIAPALAAPLIATRIDLSYPPVLVADYLVVHLGLYGGAQLLILWRGGLRPPAPRLWPMVGLLAYGIGVFGVALDRYFASFIPFGLRIEVGLAIALGAVPFMLADTLLREAGRAALWRRAAVPAAFFASLALAVSLDWDRLLFLFVILPVIVLFFVVYGLFGRWVGGRSGPTGAGLALGLILAWSLAASFPLFAP